MNSIAWRRNVKLQQKNERWQCAVTAFAMALDCPVADLILCLGHDGGAIVYPDLPYPADRQGHNLYEMIQVAVDLGYAATPIPLRRTKCYRPSKKPGARETASAG